MASSIDATKPTAGAALTADVRNNFSAAKTEIEALQADLTAGLATKLNLTGGTLSGWLKMAVGSGHYLYNLDTDASNYERGFMRWASNVLEIGAEAAGTGTARPVWLKASNGTIKWDGNSFGIGTAWALFSSGLYLSSNAIVGWSDTYNGGLGGSSVAIGRNAAGVAEINSGSAGAYRDLILRNLRTNPTTVSALIAASTAGAGARSFVTDATATTYLSVVAGGGSNAVPVVSNGTNWLIG